MSRRSILVAATAATTVGVVFQTAPSYARYTTNMSNMSGYAPSFPGGKPKTNQSNYTGMPPKGNPSVRSPKGGPGPRNYDPYPYSYNPPKADPGPSRPPQGSPGPGGRPPQGGPGPGGRQPQGGPGPKTNMSNVGGMSPNQWHSNRLGKSYGEYQRAGGPINDPFSAARWGASAADWGQATNGARNYLNQYTGGGSFSPAW
jgi:hypothetical protein